MAVRYSGRVNVSAVALMTAVLFLLGHSSQYSWPL
jgi:hypothetical protein